MEQKRNSNSRSANKARHSTATRGDSCGSRGSVTGSLLAGNNIGDALKSGVVGGLIGGASGFLSFAAGGVVGNSPGAILERMGRHAFVNMWMSGIQGNFENMWSAALTGAASSVGGAGLTALNTENTVLLTAANAVIGGTVSVIGGGKFANGAVTGAFTMLFNELGHGYNRIDRYVRKMFPGWIPADANIIWELYNGKEGNTIDRFGYGNDLRVQIPQKMWHSSDKTLLNVCIDHELVHVDDFANGSVWKWEHEYTPTQTRSIMEYRAYSHSLIYTKSNYYSNLDLINHIQKEINLFKNGLPKGWR
jgi:hypothetical protein